MDERIFIDSVLDEIPYIKNLKEEFKKSLYTDINITDIEHKTIVMHAIKYKPEVVLELLKNEDLDLLKQDFHGRTALHYAIMSQKKEIVKELIHLNKNLVTINDNQNWSPLAYSCTLKDSIYEVFLEETQEVDYKTYDNWTPLSIAASHGNVEIVNSLIDLKVDIHSTIDYDRTALHMASFHGQTNVVSLLLDFGADINALDCSGVSVIHYAVLSKNIDVLEVLIENGVDLKVFDKQMKSPYDYALDLEYSEVIDYLKGKY